MYNGNGFHYNLYTQLQYSSSDHLVPAWEVKRRILVVFLAAGGLIPEQE